MAPANGSRVMLQQIKKSTSGLPRLPPIPAERWMEGPASVENEHEKFKKARLARVLQIWHVRTYVTSLNRCARRSAHQRNNQYQQP